MDLDHTYSLVTFIPLIDGEVFTTLEIHPFPTHINKDKQYRVTFTPEDRIYFINNNKFLCIHTSHDQFKFCKTVKDIHSCPLRKPLCTFDIPNCVIILYTNGSLNELHELCEFEKLISNMIITENIRSQVFSSVNAHRKSYYTAVIFNEKKYCFETSTY